MRPVRLKEQSVSAPEVAKKVCGAVKYVQQMQSSLSENLRLYINFDMNHVDADFANRGNSLTLFTNKDDYDLSLNCRPLQTGKK